MEDFIPRHIEISNNKSGVGSIQVNAPIVGGAPSAETARTKIRNELLAKISHSNSKLRPAKDTCRWILHDEKFQSWLESSDQHLLWISGRPGKGKSHIAAFLGDQLSHRTPESSNSPLVLKVSCENTDIRRCTSLAVHLNILHQMLQFHRSDVALHEDVSSILKDVHTSLNTNIPRVDLWEIIERFVNGQSGSIGHQTYLILDGLDECDAESIEDLDKKLQHLCSAESRQVQGRPHFKTILLSRPLASISNRGSCCIDLDNDGQYGEQILQEIRLFIDAEMSSTFEAEKGRLEMLKEILSGRSNKTFLWVALALKLLKTHKDELDDLVAGRSQHVLDRLPAGLSSMYNRMLLEALRGKYDGQRNIDPASCAKVIQFIGVAFRPLTLAELEGAVDPSSNMATILSYCRHILVQGSGEPGQEDIGEDIEDDVEKIEGETFQLVHLSLKQYLQQPTKLTIPATLGLLLWPSLSFIVDILRAAMYRFYYLDLILFVATVLSLDGFFKSHPAIGFVLVTLVAIGLGKRWIQERSWLIQMLLRVFERFLDICVYGIFASSEPSSHKDLFSRSIDFLMDQEAGLQREESDNLAQPGALSAAKPMSVDDDLAPFGRYACCFWADHLCSLCDLTPREKTFYRMRVLQFLEDYFLDWLRSLSMQRKLRHGVRSVKRLIRAFEAQHIETDRLQEFLKDVERFMMQFVPIIERAPFQVYASALAFCPNSIVRSKFEDRLLPFAKKMKTIQDDWSPLLQVLEGHKGRVTSVMFSNDGKLIASTSDDNTVRLWETETGRLNRILRLGNGHAECIAFSCDGNLIISVSPGRDITQIPVVWIWDIKTGALVNSIKTSHLSIHAIACAPHDDRLAIATPDLIQLWDLETKTILKDIPNERPYFTSSIAFSPDRYLIASTGNDVKVWDVETGQLECMVGPVAGFDIYSNKGPWYLKQMARLDSLAFPANSSVTAPDHGVVQLWDSEPGKPCKTLGRHSWRECTVALSPDRKMIASCRNSSIRLWDSKISFSQRERFPKLEDDRDGVMSMMISSDKTKLATISSFGTVKLWSLNVEAQATLVVCLPDTFTPALSPRGDILAFTSRPDFFKKVHLWDVTKRKQILSLTGHNSMVVALCFSSDGHTLASLSNDCVHLWDPATGLSRHVLRSVGPTFRFFIPSPTLRPPWFVFSPDNESIAFATGSNRKTIVLWNFNSPDNSWVRFSGHTGYVDAISFSPDGTRIASASRMDATVRVWDTETGKLLQQIGKYREVKAVAFSLDGSQLISTDQDGRLIAWDLSKNTLIKMKSFAQGFSELALSECGNYLATERGMVELSTNSSLPGVYVDGEWIVRGQERVLLLPPETRANHAIMVDNLLILGCVSGRVELIQFSE